MGQTDRRPAGAQRLVVASADTGSRLAASSPQPPPPYWIGSSRNNCTSASKRSKGANSWILRSIGLKDPGPWRLRWMRVLVLNSKRSGVKMPKLLRAYWYSNWANSVSSENPGRLSKKKYPPSSRHKSPDDASSQRRPRRVGPVHFGNACKTGNKSANKSPGNLDGANQPLVHQDEVQAVNRFAARDRRVPKIPSHQTSSEGFEPVRLASRSLSAIPNFRLSRSINSRSSDSELAFASSIARACTRSSRSPASRPSTERTCRYSIPPSPCVNR